MFSFYKPLSGLCHWIWEYCVTCNTIIYWTCDPCLSPSTVCEIRWFKNHEFLLLFLGETPLVMFVFLFKTNGWNLKLLISIIFVYRRGPIGDCSYIFLFKMSGWNLMNILLIFFVVFLKCRVAVCILSRENWWPSPW